MAQEDVAPSRKRNRQRLEDSPNVNSISSPESSPKPDLSKVETPSNSLFEQEGEKRVSEGSGDENIFKKRLDREIKYEILPFQSTSSNFGGKQSSRYLCRNNCGFLAVELSPTKEESVEVFCTVAGTGKRKQIIDSTKQKYDIGSLSSIGFVLCRTKPVPSRIDFEPFTSIGQLSKASWSKTFPGNEQIVNVALTRNSLLVTTSLNYLRQFSLGGLSGAVWRGSGVRFLSLSSHHNVVAALSLRSNNCCTNHTVSYLVEFFSTNSNLLSKTGSSELNFESDDLIRWLGITPNYVPVVVTQKGLVLGYLPTSSSDSAQSLWVVLLNLADAVPTSLPGSLYISSVSDTSIFVFSTPDQSPPVTPALPLLECPFRIPHVLSSDTETLTDYVEFAQIAKKSDVEMKDPKVWKALTTELLGESVLRASLFHPNLKIRAKNLISSVATIPHTNDSLEEVQLTLRKSEANLEKLRFRLFLKALSDGRVDLALEVGREFVSSKSVRAAVEVASQRGFT